MEKSICADAELSKLDDKLNGAYKKAQTTPKMKKVITSLQREWLKSEDLTSCEDVQCLRKEMSSRTALLESVAPPSDTSAKWNGWFVGISQGFKNDFAGFSIIGLTGNRVYLAGDATNSALHTGVVKGIGTLKSGKVEWSIARCHGQMTLNGDFLTVEKEDGCGGAGVSFDGKYRRK